MVGWMAVPLHGLSLVEPGEGATLPSHSGRPMGRLVSACPQRETDALVLVGRLRGDGVRVTAGGLRRARAATAGLHSPLP